MVYTFWSVVSTPLKNTKVSWYDYSHIYIYCHIYIYGKIIQMFQTTNQHIIIGKYC